MIESDTIIIRMCEPSVNAIVNAPVGCYRCYMATARWRDETIAELIAHGWENANQLSIGAGLSYPVADRVLKNEPMDRVDMKTLAKIAKALHVPARNVLTLIEYTPDEAPAVKPRRRR